MKCRMIKDGDAEKLAKDELSPEQAIELDERKRLKWVMVLNRPTSTHYYFNILDHETLNWASYYDESDLAYERTVTMMINQVKRERDYEMYIFPTKDAMIKYIKKETKAYKKQGIICS